MIDVIVPLLSAVDQDHPSQQIDDVLLGEGASVRILISWRAELAVEIVPPHLPKVVSPRVEEQTIEQRPRVVHCGWLPRAKPPVEFQQRLFHAPDCGVLLDGRLHVRVVGIDVDILEQLQYLAVGRVSQGAQEHTDGRLPLPIHLHGDDVPLVCLELHPCAPNGNQLGIRHRLPGRRLDRGREVDAWRA